MGEPPCYAHLVDEEGRIHEAGVRIARVYDAGPGKPGEARVLVDRIWPRGVAKAGLQLDGWFRDLAPSDGLRRWFAHDPARWSEFQRRYREELSGNGERLDELAALARTRSLVLLYSARDERHNQAAVLRQAVEERLADDLA